MDLFNQLMGGMGGFNSENRRYMINGREVTLEEFAQYRATGKLPMSYDGVMGVQPLRHVIEQQIRDNVTDFHLENLDAKHLIADLEDGVLVIKEKN